jgi:hypothetical protein
MNKSYTKQKAILKKKMHDACKDKRRDLVSTYSQLYSLYWARSFLGNKPIQKLIAPRQLLHEPFGKKFMEFTSESVDVDELSSDELLAQAIEMFLSFKSAEYTSSPIRFFLTRELATAFIYTSLEKTKPQDISFPYKSFIIEVPPDFIYTKSDTKIKDVLYMTIFKGVPCALGEAIYISLSSISPLGKTLDNHRDSFSIPIAPKFPNIEKIAKEQPDILNYTAMTSMYKIPPETDIEDMLEFGHVLNALLFDFAILSKKREAHGTDTQEHQKLNNYLSEHMTAIATKEDEQIDEYLKSVLTKEGARQIDGPHGIVNGRPLSGAKFKDAIFRIIINTLLYLDSSNCDKKHIHHEEIELLKKKTKKKKSTSAHLYSIHPHRVLPPNQQEPARRFLTQPSSEVTGGGKLMAQGTVFDVSSGFVHTSEASILAIRSPVITTRCGKKTCYYESKKTASCLRQH